VINSCRPPSVALTRKASGNIVEMPLFAANAPIVEKGERDSARLAMTFVLRLRC